MGQATLPSYEEAVRTGTVINATNSSHNGVYCTWPAAPPSYDSVLILDESSGNTTCVVSVQPSQSASPVEASSNVSFVERYFFYSFDFVVFFFLFPKLLSSCDCINWAMCISSDEAAGDSPVGTTTTSEDDDDEEDEEDDEAEAVEGA